MPGNTNIDATPIVIVNVGWMRDYKGPKNDQIVGGHGYLQANNIGHEAWNFEPLLDRVYGYVPGGARINIRTLGASSKALSAEGITVVWVAREPEGHRRTKVVGWYRNASIHTDSKHYRMQRGDLQLEYQIDAPANQATLLNEDQRVLVVPTAKLPGNMGQRPIWYGNPVFLDDLRQHIAQFSGFPKTKTKGRPSHQSDPEARKRIELAAVRHATDHFSSLTGGSRIVESVEKDNQGWDLNVFTTSARADYLRVEVKGLSGTNVCVEFTPNEYKQMQSKEHRADYVVYVVTQAGSVGETAHVFYFHAERSIKESRLIWQTRDGQTLKIEPIIGARLSVE